MSDVDISASASFLFPGWQALQNSTNASLLQASFICVPTHYQNISDSFVATEGQDVGLATGHKHQGKNCDLQMFIICTLP